MGVRVILELNYFRCLVIGFLLSHIESPFHAVCGYFPPRAEVSSCDKDWRTKQNTIILSLLSKVLFELRVPPP